MKAIASEAFVPPVDATPVQHWDFADTREVNAAYLRGDVVDGEVLGVTSPVGEIAEPYVRPQTDAPSFGTRFEAPASRTAYLPASTLLDFYTRTLGGWNTQESDVAPSYFDSYLEGSLYRSRLQTLGSLAILLYLRDAKGFGSLFLISTATER